MAADAHPQLGFDVPAEPLPPAFVPQGYDTGHCKYCKQRIIWTTMVDALGDVKVKGDGQPVRNPINVRTDPQGRLRLIGHGRAASISPLEFVDPRERRQSHWATCPERKKAAAARDSKSRRSR